MATQDRGLYAKKVGTDLNALSTKLRILEAAARQKPGDSTFDYKSRIPDLRRQHDDIENRLNTLEDGGREDWDTTRTEIEDAIQDLQDDISAAMDEAGLTSEREIEKQQPPRSSHSSTDSELRVP